MGGISLRFDANCCPVLWKPLPNGSGGGREGRVVWKAARAEAQQAELKVGGGMYLGAPSRASIHHSDKVNSVPLVSAEVMTTCRALTAYCSFLAGEVCSVAQRFSLPLWIQELRCCTHSPRGAERDLCASPINLITSTQKDLNPAFISHRKHSVLYYCLWWNTCTVHLVHRQAEGPSGGVLTSGKPVKSTNVPNVQKCIQY